jgi:hypothetical protein
MLFNNINYRDWAPCMRLHMHGFRFWKFLTGELPCPSSPSAPTQPAISEKIIAAEKERLLSDYDDCLDSYESQFSVYMTWLDEDARAGSVFVASMEDQFFADMMEFEWAHQMWTFLRDRYEPTEQSTFLIAIR